MKMAWDNNLERELITASAGDWWQMKQNTIVQLIMLSFVQDGPLSLWLSWKSTKLKVGYEWCQSRVISLLLSQGNGREWTYITNSVTLWQSR